MSLYQLKDLSQFQLSHGVKQGRLRVPNNSYALPCCSPECTSDFALQTGCQPVQSGVMETSYVDYKRVMLELLKLTCLNFQLFLLITPLFLPIVSSQVN